MDGATAGPWLRQTGRYRPIPGDADVEADRHLYGRIVGFATIGADIAATEALGLSRPALARLIDRFLPERRDVVDALPAGAAAGDDAIEEPDIRAYLLECRAGADEAEDWAAAIVARRSRQPNHLWQDMGFADRGELNLFLRRHFPELVRRNVRDMKWKKFLYRELCQRDGVLICKSPVCDACSDVADCFGGEPGEPLQTLARLDQPALRWNHLSADKLI